MAASIKANILATYASQIYVTLVGMAMLPIYIRYLGVEAYGLVGFFLMLQAWLVLLDLGLSPTLMRETARHNAGALDAAAMRGLLHLLELVFLAIAVVAAAILASASGWIATEWLNVENLPLSEVQGAVAVMAPVLALRFVSALYRSVITGFERLVWLGSFNAFIATCRFVLVIPFFLLFEASILAFFWYQFAIAIVEIGILLTRTYLMLPRLQPGARAKPEWRALQPSLKFALGIAFTGSIWVVITNLDKLILSSLLPLSQYALFSLAVIAASGVTILSAPLGTALVPRLTHLDAEGNDGEFIGLYRRSTQLVAATALPAALMLAIFPEQILWAWTGDWALSRSAAPILTLYGLGNGALAIAVFPFYLQLAKGKLRLHAIGVGLFMIMLVPAIAAATLRFGMIGAGFAWLGLNLVYLLTWTPVVHRRFATGMHGAWLLRDVVAVVAPAVIAAFILRELVVWPDNRILVALALIMTGASLMLMAAASSPLLRRSAAHVWGKVTARLVLR